MKFHAKSLDNLKQLSNQSRQGQRPTSRNTAQSRLDEEKWEKKLKQCSYLVHHRPAAPAATTTIKLAKDTFVRDQVPHDQNPVVKILLVLSTGEISLISFDVPDKCITVQDLLCQVLYII